MKISACILLLVSTIFAEPVKIKLTDNTSQCVDPAISIDPFGNAHVVWQDNRCGDWEIFYAKIDANGAILINNINVSQSGAQSITPDVSTDGDGNAYIVWIERDELYYAVLDGSGKKSVEKIQIVGYTCAVPAISTLSNGTSNISFEYRQTTIYKFYYVQVDSKGKIIDKAVQLADWDILGEKWHYSGIDNDLAGNSYIFYRYRNTGLFPLDHALFYAKIGPARNVLVHGRIKNRPHADHPAVAAADPNLFLIYSDDRGAGRGIYDLKNVDDDIRVDQGGVNADYPTVASDQTHNTYIAWSDEREGNQEIYLSHLNEENKFVESNVRITETTGNSTLPDIDMDGHGNYYLVWQDETDGDWELWMTKGPNEFVGNDYQKWSFAHITDIHVGTKKQDEIVFSDIYPPFLEIKFAASFCNAIEDIAKLPNMPTFILVTGDVAELADPYYFRIYRTIKSIFTKNYNINIYEVPGNHDRYKFEVPLSIVASDENLEKYYDTMECPSEIWNPDGASKLNLLNNFAQYNNTNNLQSGLGLSYFNFYFEYRQYQFIGIDSGADDKDLADLHIDFKPESKGIHDLQIKALKELNIDKKKIIFMHHPIYKKGILKENASITQNRLEFIDYCQKRNVKLVLSGHTHENVIHDRDGTEATEWPLRETPNNWDGEPIFVQTSSVTKEENNGYRIINVLNEEELSIEESTLHDNYPIFHQMCFAEGSGTLHSYDSQKRHTGYKIDNIGQINKKAFPSMGSFATDIPHSYYLGYYDESKPQAIILYNPHDDYHFELAGFSDDTSRIGAIVSDIVFEIPGIKITPSTLDKFKIESDSTFTYATSDNQKYFGISISRELNDNYRSFKIENTTISKIDTFRFKFIGKARLSFANVGEYRTYDLALSQIGTDTTKILCKNIAIARKQTHVVEPTSWESLGSADIKVGIDQDSNGTIDSTAIVHPLTRVKQGLSIPQPDEFGILVNYPNPFNSQTTIRYDLSEDSHVRLGVYDVLGRCVCNLMDMQVDAGSHNIQWNGKNDNGEEMPSGMYILTMQINGLTEYITKSTKMVLLK